MSVSCPSCGFALNKENDSRCFICHNPLPCGAGQSNAQNSRMDSREDTPRDDPRQSPPGMSGPGVSRESGSAMSDSADPWQSKPARPEPRPPIWNDRDLQPEAKTCQTGSGLNGRISHLERHDETPMFDGYRLTSQCMIFLILFIPYLLLFLTTGALSLVFAVIGFGGVARIFNPIAWSTAIFELLEIIALRRVSGALTVPIYRGMVEDEQSRQYAFMVQGPLAEGNLVLGHQVEFIGTNRRGTFIVSQGRDLTVRNDIVIRNRLKWRIILCMTLSIYCFVGYGIYSHWSQINGSPSVQVLKQLTK